MWNLSQQKVYDLKYIILIVHILYTAKTTLLTKLEQFLFQYKKTICTSSCNLIAFAYPRIV